MAQGGYEFSVAILAILSLGAAAVPMGEFITICMSRAQPLTLSLAASATLKEAIYFRRTAGACVVIGTSERLRICSQLANEDSAFFALSAAQGLNQPRLAVKDMLISCNWALSPSAPGLVIFTSGQLDHQGVSSRSAISSPILLRHTLAGGSTVQKMPCCTCSPSTTRPASA